MTVPDPEILPVGSSRFKPVKLQSADGASALITPHGAQVVSWKPAGDLRERLFLSGDSEYRENAAIRGGVPVIFPQFAAEGPLPKHGFARTALWTLIEHDKTDNGAARAKFQLLDSAATRQLWPHHFAATLEVLVSAETLAITLAIANPGTQDFSFSAALHTYLHVADVRMTTVHGLQGLCYRDSAEGGILKVERAEALRIEGEVDRIYLDAPTTLEVRQPASTLRIGSSGFKDAVVWNPGPMRGAALTDMETDGYLKMLCVEAAVIAEPVVLKAGEHWRGTQSLHAV